MSELVDFRQLLTWLTTSLYMAVFVGVLIDATGIPFPGRLLLIAAGALSRTDHAALAWVIAIAAAAAVAMDLAWYIAGRWSAERVLALYRKLPGWRRGRDDDPPEYFARYGAATIPIGRFFLSVRVIAWPVAAARGVGYAKFIALDVLAAALWASLWVGLGAVVGTGWVAAAETASIWMLLAGVVILLVFLGLVWIYVRRARARRSSRGGRRRGDAVIATSR